MNPTHVWQLDLGACPVDSLLTRFRVWAPHATSVAVRLVGQERAPVSLAMHDRGYFEGTDKGRACRVLIDLYRRERGDIKTVGLGDSLNDRPMLEVVDRPFLVERPGGGYAEGISVDGVTHAKGVGPEGWANAILQLHPETSLSDSKPPS